MKKLLFVLFFTGLLTKGQAQQIEIGDIVATDSKIERAGTGFLFTEGPAMAADGRIFFTDQPNNSIMIWDETAGISLFTANSQRSNGLFFDIKGNLVACADLYNNLVAFSPEGKVTILFDGIFDGKHINAPNDLWLDANGGIYFTDPYYHREWWPEEHREVQDSRAVYYLNSSGNVSRVATGFMQPNGIVGNHYDSILYIADIDAGKTWKYFISKPGMLTNQSLFANEGSDGMTVDALGNVYLTNDAVSVFDKNGNKLGIIKTPETPANICFGGIERNILFITARTSVYTLRMKVQGMK